MITIYCQQHGHIDYTKGIPLFSLLEPRVVRSTDKLMDRVFRLAAEQYLLLWPRMSRQKRASMIVRRPIPLIRSNLSIHQKMHPLDCALSEPELAVLVEGIDMSQVYGNMLLRDNYRTAFLFCYPKLKLKVSMT